MSPRQPPGAPGRNPVPRTGGTGRFASPPARFRAALRGVPRLLGRTPNSSGCNDSSPGGGARCPPGRLGSRTGGISSPSRSCAAAERFPQTLHAQLISARSDTHQEVGWRDLASGTRQPFGTDDLSQAALQLIALHDRMPVAGNDDAGSWRCGRGFSPEDLDRAASTSRTHLQEGSDLRPAPQPGRPGIPKALPVTQGSGARKRGLPAVLRAHLVAHREGMTPLTATAGQDLPPGLRLHTGTKAVVLQALTSARIPERRLHFSSRSRIGDRTPLI